MDHSDPTGEFYRDPVTGWVRLDRFANGDFACCICFDRTNPEEAYTDLRGQKWDMCTTCGRLEDMER